MTDSKAPWLARGSAIALMMAAGIALAACGGGGGLNEDEGAGLKQELEEAQTQAAAALAAQQVEEAARIAAEAAQATAEAEKATAEAEKAVADAAREVAVADAAAAETAKATAVAEKDKAEAEKVAADTARKAAEADAAAAETARLAAVAEKATADTAREAAVAAKVTAEAEAATAQAATETAVAEAAEARTAQQAAEKARDAAEMARIAAEENADGQVALAETANMAAQVADAAVVQANADLIVARDMQKQAEDDRDAALADEKEAQRQLQLAQQATAIAEQQSRDSDAALDEAEQDTEDALQEANRAGARDAIRGLGGLDAAPAAPAGTVSDTGGATAGVMASYRAAADVTTNPLVTFASTTTGSDGRWFRTSLSNHDRTNIDRLDVYSDVERLPDVAFKDSIYNSDVTADFVDDLGVTTTSAVVDMEGKVVNWVDILGRRDDAASSAFPRMSGLVRPTRVDRGITKADFEAVVAIGMHGIIDDNENMRVDVDDLPEDTSSDFTTILNSLGITQQELLQYVRRSRSFRNVESYPLRWHYEARGTLGGASGTYRCASQSSGTCTVQNSGGHFVFSEDWSFQPLRATVGVDIEDSVYMYFGWWSRQATADNAWSFAAFHGPAASRVEYDEITTDGNDVSGNATYRGRAAGYYAIYQPAGAQSGHGAFTATATLQANFDTDMVQGTIDQFSGHPDWSLTLRREDLNDDGSIGDGADTDTDTVVWSIGGDPNDDENGGTWEANFYSNLVDNDPKTNEDDMLRNGAIPSGIAGTFRATYDDVGRLVGAFGAHCTSGC